MSRSPLLVMFALAAQAALGPAPLWLVVSLTVAQLACGGSVRTEASQDSGAADSSIPDASWSPSCPESQPAVGAACTHETLECEYGSAWWSIACDRVLQCKGGVWTTEQLPGTCTPAPGPNAAACPAESGSVEAGSSCPAAGLTCYYGEGANCACEIPVFSTPDAGPSWICEPEPGCPSTTPRLGAPCSGSTAMCTYVDCSYGTQCIGGIWQSYVIGC